MEYLGLWNYWAVIVLMMVGLYIIIARDNLVKKMMGLTIFQVAAIMLYVSMGKVKGGTAPILTGQLPKAHGEGHGAAAGGEAHAAGEAAAVHGAEAASGHGGEHAETAAEAVTGANPVCIEKVCPDAMYGMWDAAQQACECGYFSNPLPHVLMLTAIVVGIATTALGLAIVVRIYEAYGTVEEDEIAVLDGQEA